MEIMQVFIIKQVNEQSNNMTIKHRTSGILSISDKIFIKSQKRSIKKVNRYTEKK